MEPTNVVLNLTNEKGEPEQKVFETFILIGFTEDRSQFVINKVSTERFGYCIARLQTEFINALAAGEGGGT
jgi:hypothetical protein